VRIITLHARVRSLGVRQRTRQRVDRTLLLLVLEPRYGLHRT
jgi:hypothetical protein